MQGHLNLPSNYFLANANTSAGTSFASIVNHPPGMLYPRVISDECNNSIEPSNFLNIDTLNLCYEFYPFE